MREAVTVGIRRILESADEGNAETDLALSSRTRGTPNKFIPVRLRRGRGARPSDSKAFSEGGFPQLVRRSSPSEEGSAA